MVLGEVVVNGQSPCPRGDFILVRCSTVMLLLLRFPVLCTSLQLVFSLLMGASRVVETSIIPTSQVTADLLMSAVVAADSQPGSVRFLGDWLSLTVC